MKKLFFLFTLLAGGVLLAQTPPINPSIINTPPPPQQGTLIAWTDFNPSQLSSGLVDRLGRTCGPGFDNIQVPSGANGLRLTSFQNTSGQCDGILSAANADGFPDQGMAGQTTSKAFRHIRGAVGGGSIKHIFPLQTDVSVSFLMRYSQGFTWSGGGNPGYTKETYGGVGDEIIFGHQGGAWGINIGGGVNYPGSINWTQTMGGSAGDGIFHCYEYRLNFTTKTMEVWVDGVKSLNRTNVNFQNATGYADFWYSNQSAIQNGGYVDYDRIRIATGLPIGARLTCGY